MQVVFGDTKLEKIETEEAGYIISLPISVIKAARKRIEFIRAAPDERSLRNWKSLHYEKLKGGRSNQRSIKINDQWRMILRINTRSESPMVTIDSIEDYH